MSDGILEPKLTPRVYGLAYGLWFATAVLGVLTFIAGREMIVRTYARFFPLDARLAQAGQGGLSLVNILVTLPLATLAIAIIIGGFEYQHRNMGKPKAWQILSRTLAIECGLLLLALFI
jgi:hypothetical protein